MRAFRRIACVSALAILNTHAVFAGSRTPIDWSAVFEDVDDVPRLLGQGVISTGDDESHPTLSPVDRTLYFLKNAPSFDFWTIVISEYRDGGWGRPRTAPFSGQFADADIVFTPDGKRAYFVSMRPVDGQPRTDTEIWTVERRASGWGEPQHVNELSSPADEWFPTLAANGAMYFGSSRPGGAGGSDIWRSRNIDGVFQPPENLGAPVNSAGQEIEAFVSPEEDLLIIAARDRGDSLGSYDLYVTRRSGNHWQPPRHLGAPINSPAWEFSPRLSPDGKVLLFTSSRGFGSTPLQGALTFDELEQRVRSPGNGLRDIYVVSARVLDPKE